MNRKFGLLTRMREPHYSEICCLDHLLKAMAELAFLHNCFSYSQHTFSWIFDADLSLTSTPMLILLTVCEHNFTPLLSYRHTHTLPSLFLNAMMVLPSFETLGQNVLRQFVMGSGVLNKVRLPYACSTTITCTQTDREKELCQDVKERTSPPVRRTMVAPRMMRNLNITPVARSLMCLLRLLATPCRTLTKADVWKGKEASLTFSPSCSPCHQDERQSALFFCGTHPRILLKHETNRDMSISGDVRLSETCQCM